MNTQEWVKFYNELKSYVEGIENHNSKKMNAYQILLDSDGEEEDKAALIIFRCAAEISNFSIDILNKMEELIVNINTKEQQDD